MEAVVGVVFSVAFSLWGSDVTWLEVAALLLSLAMVACNLRVNPLGWPLAIVSSILYGLLFARSRLYGEASLQLIFVALAGWGWWQWRLGRSADGNRLRVRSMPPRLRWWAAGVTLAAWPLLGLLLQRATDSDVPFLDALPTVASITGQVLLARKFVENWPTWLMVNVASVGLFAIKGLWLTVMLYGIFVLLSAVGWRAWRRLAAAGGSTASPMHG